MVSDVDGFERDDAQDQQPEDREDSKRAPDIKLSQGNRSGLFFFADQQPGDEGAADDEENRHAQMSTIIQQRVGVPRVNRGVADDYQKDRKSAQSVKRGQMILR